MLESLDIPLVLGNGWSCAYKGVIYATQWKIFLTAPPGKRVEYQRGPLLRRHIHAKLPYPVVVSQKVGSKDGLQSIRNNRHSMQTLFTSCDPET